MLPTSDIPGLLAESVPIITHAPNKPTRKKLRARFYLDGVEVRHDDDDEDTND